MRRPSSVAKLVMRTGRHQLEPFEPKCLRMIKSIVQKPNTWPKTSSLFGKQRNWIETPWLEGCCCTAAACCWLLAAGCVCHGCLLLAAGCWLLAVGCWLLAAGCWLLACVFSFFTTLAARPGFLPFWKTALWASAAPTKRLFGRRQRRRSADETALWASAAPTQLVNNGYTTAIQRRSYLY